MLTVAVSPSHMYSSARAWFSLTQPRPVPVATLSTARSKPPVRSSSSTARAASSRRSTSPSVPTPTYARTGCWAGRPVNASIVSALGALAMNTRPCRPRRSQVSPEAGPAESAGLVGAGRSVLNSSLIAMNVASRVPSSRAVTTPVTST